MVYMVYVANDVIQNSVKKDKSKFPRAFLRALLNVLPYARKEMNESNNAYRWEKVARVIKILDER